MQSLDALRPADEAELAALIADAAARGARLELRGGGSKAGIGAPVQASVVELSGFSRVTDYDPAELVLTCGAGTPLAEVEAAVAAEGQMLAFEPFDHGPLLGGEAGRATIGGVLAAAVSGSRRLSRGAARDHLLGFRAVSGRGEAFVGGAKVVKNVTGYDLPKLAAGSWGRLFAMTEVTVKALPRPEMTRTVALEGLDAAAAVAAMASALGSQAEVAAAAHVPDGAGLTAFRLEGFGPSVGARMDLMKRLTADRGPLHVLSEAEAAAFWGALRRLDGLEGRPLWRLSLPSRASAAVADELQAAGARWRMDWGGSLLWVAFEGDPAAVRQAAERAGGHAALVRAGEAMRRTVPPHHPRSAAVMALEARVRRAFDPMGVFETGRFLDHPHAD